MCDKLQDHQFFYKELSTQTKFELYCASGELHHAKDLAHMVDRERGLKLACICGKSNIIRWLSKYQRLDLECHRALARSGHLPTIAEFADPEHYPLILSISAGLGNTGVVTWLLNHISPTSESFYSSLVNGKYQTAELLICNVKNTFVSLCIAGNLKSTKWLFGKADISISEDLFFLMCKLGHFDMVVWFFLIKKIPTNAIKHGIMWSIIHQQPKIRDWLTDVISNM
jgi:hypothetical protein